MSFCSRVLVCVVFLLTLGFFVSPQISFAAEATEAVKKSVPIANTPVAIEKRHTQVAVEYDGNDSIGASLSMRVKEVFNTSSLFLLSENDTPKIRLLISTKPEFPSRPGVGSVYSVVWVFSQSENTLRHFLQSEVGVLTPDEVPEVAAKLIEKTDALAVKYGYLF